MVEVPIKLLNSVCKNFLSFAEPLEVFHQTFDWNNSGSSPDILKICRICQIWPASFFCTLKKRRRMKLTANYDFILCSVRYTVKGFTKSRLVSPFDVFYTCLRFKHGPRDLDIKVFLCVNEEIAKSIQYSKLLIHTSSQRRTPTDCKLVPCLIPTRSHFPGKQTGKQFAVCRGTPLTTHTALLIFIKKSQLTSVYVIFYFPIFYSVIYTHFENMQKSYSTWFINALACFSRIRTRDERPFTTRIVRIRGSHKKPVKLRTKTTK